MANVFDVAHLLCEKSGWCLTNLKLHKMLYIAQMFSIGRRGVGLFDARIEAWEYGPVVPEVYHELKYAGNSAIPPFLFPLRRGNLEHEEISFISEIYNMVKDFRGWELVAITHRDGGAWSNNYEPGKHGILISSEDMKREYDNLWSKNA